MIKKGGLQQQYASGVFATLHCISRGASFRQKKLWPQLSWLSVQSHCAQTSNRTIDWMERCAVGCRASGDQGVHPSVVKTNVNLLSLLSLMTSLSLSQARLQHNICVPRILWCYSMGRHVYPIHSRRRCIKINLNGRVLHRQQLHGSDRSAVVEISYTGGNNRRFWRNVDSWNSRTSHKNLLLC